MEAYDALAILSNVCYPSHNHTDEDDHERKDASETDPVRPGRKTTPSAGPDNVNLFHCVDV